MRHSALTQFLVFATVFCLFDDAIASPEADDYFDSLLKNRLPSVMTEEGATVIKLPEFSQPFQNRTSDGSITNGRIRYYNGNLTGLSQAVRRGSCGELLWFSANRTTSCSIEFPKIQVNYRARIKYENTALQRTISVDGEMKGVIADLTVTSSARFNIPYLTTLNLVDTGEINIIYVGIKKLHYDALAFHFRDNFYTIFDEIFYGRFRTLLERSISLEPLPLENV